MYTWRWSIDIPECPLLCVENLPLLFVSLLVHLGLCLRLHEDVLPLPAEHLLEAGQVLGLVVGQLQSGLVLHRSLAEVDRVVRVLRGPALRRPVVRGLKIDSRKRERELMLEIIRSNDMKFRPL